MPSALTAIPPAAARCPWTRLPLALLVVVWSPLASAQSTLGELLDAGARKLSAEEFRQELVQRVIIGPTLVGGYIELMYVPNGTIQGAGSDQRAATAVVPVFGQWNVDADGRVCTTMRITMVNPGGEVTLPSRCQVWFKTNGQYFLSDSDWDRSAKVLKRTVK